MKLVARLAVAGFVALAAFQVVLAAGAPLGRAAWGGAHAELSQAERVGSAVSALFYGVAIYVVAGRARGRTQRRFRVGTWTLVPIFALATVANLASESRWENVLLAPLALALTAACAAVAVGMRRRERGLKTG